MKLINVIDYPTKIMVDDEDYSRVKKHNWSLTSDLTVVRTSIDHKTISIANFILNRVAKREILVDHKDRNIFNNQKSNFRIATRQQNLCNTKRKWSLFLKGVRQVSNSHLFQARIQFNGKSYSLGCFDTEEDAGRAYDKKAKELHGEFACLNFPE